MDSTDGMVMVIVMASGMHLTLLRMLDLPKGHPDLGPKKGGIATGTSVLLWQGRLQDLAASNCESCSVGDHQVTRADP